MNAQRILVVDDDRDVVAEIRALLETHGYQVMVAHDGRQAMHLLGSNEDVPSLMLVDVHMPVMDGWNFLAVLRSYTAWSNIPVILITADPVERDSGGLFEAALRKPIAPATLLQTVAQVCAAGRARR